MAIVPSTSRHCMTQMYVQGGGCTPYLTPNMWPSVKDHGICVPYHMWETVGLPLTACCNG